SPRLALWRISARSDDARAHHAYPRCTFRTRLRHSGRRTVAHHPGARTPVGADARGGNGRKSRGSHPLRYCRKGPRATMILPTLTHIIIQGFCVVTLILTLMFWPQFAALWAIGYGLLWCVLLLDALTLIGTPKRLHASPVLAERWSLGEEAFLDCVLSNTSGWRPAFGRVVLSTDGAFHHAPIVAWR